MEALLRQFRPAIVRYCRARLASAGARARTGSLDEDDVAQEVCLALVSALPSYRDMGRPFGALLPAGGPSVRPMGNGTTAIAVGQVSPYGL